MNAFSILTRRNFSVVSRRTAVLLIALSGVASAPLVHAHAVGTSYLHIAQDTSVNTVQTRVELSLRDLEFSVGLDSDGDARITWGEVSASAAVLDAYVARKLVINRGAEACTLSAADIAIDKHADEVYAVLAMLAQCPATGVLQVQSNLFFEIDDSHRTLLATTDSNDNTITVLTHDARTWSQSATPADSIAATWAAFQRFVAQGIMHIWIGFDHLAFLLLLLLPLTRAANTADNARATHHIKQILKVVTAFTAAHSITLACAALGYVQLPSRWVEAAIAASIVIAALANLSNAAARFGIAMAFGFGLIHGLGFASALADITANTASRVVPLIGFNLGVEIGQLVVVAATFPILFLWRGSLQLKERTVVAGSLVMGALGVAWLAQRTLLS